MIPTCSLDRVVSDQSPQDESPISEQDKISLKSQLVPAMIALSNPVDKAIRAQIAASVSLIAELAFPQAWPDLVDVRDPLIREITVHLFGVACVSNLWPRSAPTISI